MNENEPSCSKNQFKTSKHKCTMWCFSVLIDNKKNDCNNFQMMRCILCYNSFVNASNLNSQTRKDLISYYKTNDIITFNKYVNAKHTNITTKS
jgi:hypothetical protein